MLIIGEEEKIKSRLWRNEVSGYALERHTLSYSFHAPQCGLLSAQPKINSSVLSRDPLHGALFFLIHSHKSRRLCTKVSESISLNKILCCLTCFIRCFVIRINILLISLAYSWQTPWRQAHM